MKLRKLRRSVLVFIALTCANSFAFESVSRTSESLQDQVTHPSPPSRWSLEGLLQAHSVAGPASPWVGIGLDYRILQSLNVGARGFLPLSRTVDNATYSLQSFVRVRTYHGTNTDLFLEPEYGVNFYNFLPFTSYGLAVGAMNHIAPDLALGVFGGVELAHLVIDSIGVEKRSDLLVYPKVALVGNFNF